MTSVEVEARRMRGKMGALQGNCRSASVDAPSDTLAVVALPERSLSLKGQVTKR